MSKTTKRSEDNKPEAVSREPYLRAMERIEALEARGQDAHGGTLRRLNATSKPDKIQGIYEAALDKGWGDIAELAGAKLDTIRDHT